jgi:GNAT superfamily N-acetyltransferase
VSPPYRCRFYQNLLDLKRGASSVRIQVGLAAVIFHGSTAGWNSNDFFVPPSLWGAGIGGHFLRGLLERISNEAAWCIVVVRAPAADQAHQVARDDRQAFVEHYKKVGFREKLTLDTELERGLGGQLGYDEGRDTLLTLDLQQWRARTGPKPTRLSTT